MRLKVWLLVAGAVVVAVWVVSLVVATSGTRCVQVCGREPQCIRACRGMP